MKKTILTIFFLLIFLVTPNIVFATEEVVEVGTYEELRNALESGKSVKLIDNIEIEGNSVLQSSRSLGVAITGSGEIIVDGNGFTISDNNQTVRTNLEIYAEGGPLNVTLKNITVTNSYTKGRALDTRTGNITLNLINTKIKTSGSNNTQSLIIGGPTGPVIVNITNSEIEAKDAGYGIITYNPVNMTIQNSTITGYAALYMKAADNSQGSNGSIITVKNTNLNGKNVYSGISNNFGAVVFEDGDINITVQDSKVNAIGNGSASQSAFTESKNGTQEGVSFSKPNTIKISGKSTINAKNELLSLLSNSTAQITISSGVSSNKAIPEKYLPQGVVNKELSDGTFITDVIEVESRPQIPETPEIPETSETLEKPEKAEKDKTPKTGTTNTTYIWIAIAVLSLIGMVTKKSN